MRLAEFNDTDVTDMDKCLNDMQQFAQLDESSARVVASAWRDTFIRTAGPSLGLSDNDISDLIGQPGKPQQAAEFAKDTNNDESPSGDFDDTDQEDDSNFDDLDDLGEDDDELSTDTPDDLSTGTSENDDFNNNDDMAELNVSVPTTKLEDVEEALRAILGDDAFSDFNTQDVHDQAPDDTDALGKDFDADGDDDSDMDGLDLDDDSHLSDEDTDDDSSSGFPPSTPPSFGAATPEHTAGRVNTMSNKTAGKSARKEILARLDGALAERTASDIVKPKDIGLGDDTSHNGKPFSYAEGDQYKGEDKRKTMTLQGENPMKDQNPSYNPLTVPTLHEDRLQLKGSYKTTKFEGSEGDKSFYDSEFAFMDTVPASGSEDIADTTEVPTQMGDITTDRKNTVASTTDPDAEFEDHVYRTLEASNIPGEILEEMTWEEGVEAYNTIMSRRAALETTDPSDVLDMFKSASKAKRAKIDQMAADLDIKVTNADDDEPVSKRKAEATILAERKKVQEHYAAALEAEKKRIKAAYAVATRLVIAEALDENDLEGTVNMWLGDGLGVKSIFNHGSLMLKNAQARGLRQINASTDGERASRVVTAGLSTVPSVVTSRNDSAPRELSQVLGSFFSVGDVPRDEFNKMMALRRAKEEYQF
jgi:hypothetical protein